MSSHHFVKEDQEPALLILDTHTISFEKIQELLEWSPAVIVTDEVSETALGWGIKIDVVISSVHRLEEVRANLAEQAPLKLLSCSPGESQAECAFQYLIACKQLYVNLISGDLPDFALYQRFSDRLHIVVFHRGIRWSLIPDGKFEKWLAKDTFIKIIETEKDTQQITVGKDGVMKIEKPGPLWIGEDL